MGVQWVAAGSRRSRRQAIWAGFALGALGALAAACGHTKKGTPILATAGSSATATGGEADTTVGGARSSEGGSSSSQAGSDPITSAGQTNDLCGFDQTSGLQLEPLFVANAADQREPILKKLPNGHLIYRGAARARMRHEMEAQYPTFTGYYFENRTFGYVLDDGVAAGDGTIKLTFLPDANQYTSQQMVNQEGGADTNVRFWKIYGHLDGNAFAANFGGANKDFLPTMCQSPAACNTRHYEYVLDFNQREQRAIQVGDQLQIELGLFLARYSLDGTQGPPLDAGHVRNNTPVPNGCTENGTPYNNACYTQANYYTDSIRYVAGKGTLTPYNEDCAMSVTGDSPVSGNNGCAPDGEVARAVKAGTLKDRTGPSEAGWSGGYTTLPYLRWRPDLYYSQMSPNILDENADSFVKGRRLSHLQLDSGENDEVNNVVSAAETKPYTGIAGPLYNQVSCVGCHTANNRGVTPKAGTELDSVVLELRSGEVDEHGGPVGDANYGLSLQNHASAGATAEGHAAFSYQTVSTSFDDGTQVTLRKPQVAFDGLSSGEPGIHSARLARPIIGMGLLEAIPEADILALADPTDCNADGISGVPNVVWDPEDGQKHLGRFGWKATQASARQQVARDLWLYLGVTSTVFPQADCASRQQAYCQAPSGAQPELANSDLERLVTYVRTLAVPPRRDINDAAVQSGLKLFVSSGCAGCHSVNQHTGNDHPFLELRDQVIHPYTDLLLHDMGPDLADAMSPSEFAASASEWRTPPLWGIGLCDDVAAGFQLDGVQNNPSPDRGPCSYLHDGRAESLMDAILWHGGEASNAQQKVRAMSKADRDALVAFLKSL